MNLTTTEQLALITNARTILMRIPNSNFVIGVFIKTQYDINTNKEEVCGGCALGHYVMEKCKLDNIAFDVSDVFHYNSSDDINLSKIKEEARNLYEITEDYLREVHRINNKAITTVNDYTDVNGYTESEIKDRVIHFLNDTSAWLQNKMEQENGINKQD